MRFGAGLLVPLQGATADPSECCCPSGVCVCAFRVLLLEWCLCALERACWCRCRVLLRCRSRALLWNLGAGALQGGRCEMSMAVWVLVPDGDYVYSLHCIKKGACLVAAQKYFVIQFCSLRINQFVALVSAGTTVNVRRCRHDSGSSG